VADAWGLSWGGAWGVSWNIPEAPQPSPAGTQAPSGGYFEGTRRRRTKRDIEEDRLRYGIPIQALEVIEDVALSQAKRLETDRQKQFEELLRELELNRIEWHGRYLEALNGIRTALIEQEIADRLNAKLQEEEIIFVLMAAS
jgi:hypothetical protein